MFNVIHKPIGDETTTWTKHAWGQVAQRTLTTGFINQDIGVKKAHHAHATRYGKGCRQIVTLLPGREFPSKCCPGVG